MNPAPEPEPTSMSRPFRKGLPGQFEPASPAISEETSRPIRATYPRRLEPGIRATWSQLSQAISNHISQTRQPHAGQSQPPSRSSTPTRPGPNPGPLQPPERDRQDALHLPTWQQNSPVNRGPEPPQHRGQTPREPRQKRARTGPETSKPDPPDSTPQNSPNTR